MPIEKQSPWKIQKSVVFALFVRSLKSRFGAYKLGYFWALMDPVFAISVLCVIRVAMGSGDIAGLSFPLFFASGMLFYRVFRDVGQSSLGQIESNMGLMNYQRIKPMDPILAKAILEVLISAASIAIVLGGLVYFGFEFEIDSVIHLIAVYALLVGFSFGIGLVLATVSPFFQDFKRVVPVLLQPLFFLSGIFFSLNSIPESYRPYLTWNPILHAIDLARDALFEGYTSLYASLFYLFICTLCSMTFGLLVFRRYRVTIVTSGTIKLA